MPIVKDEKGDRMLRCVNGHTEGSGTTMGSLGRRWLGGTPLSVYTCKECGYTEFYYENTSDLVERRP